MKKLLLFALLALVACTSRSASVPYFESFDSYATGDTPVTNFSEFTGADWTIVSSFSGNAYQNVLSASAGGIGVSAGQSASAAIDFPSLASSGFLIFTSFRIDSLTTTSVNPNGNAFVGLVARATDGFYPATGADRYEVSYYLDGSTSVPTGKLFLTEKNASFGDSLGGALSSGTLPVVLGDIYSFTFNGVVSGGSLDVTATLTDVTASTSISVAATDSANVLAGTFFGYSNGVRVQDGGTTAMNVDFDNFAAAVPEPGVATLFMISAILFACRRHSPG